MAEAKEYTLEEIRKIAPGYRGKPENFDPNKVGRKRKTKANKPNSANKSENKSGVPATHDLTQELLNWDCFDIPGCFISSEPAPWFSENYAVLPQLAEHMYRQYNIDRNLDQLLTKEELSYYCTAMLWLRLLFIKKMSKPNPMTEVEDSLVYRNDDYNLPEPLYRYLLCIGNIPDSCAMRGRLLIPVLPTSEAGGFGGYHAPAIDLETHNLFEEVPCLGIAADMVMALTSDDDEPRPDFRVRVPPNSTYSDNLLGSFPTIGPRSPSIKRKLAGYGISTTSFPEYEKNTRFDFFYLKHISAELGMLKTFSVRKVRFGDLPVTGHESQIIVSRPIVVKGGEENDLLWTLRKVRQTCTVRMSGAVMETTFQLYKESSGEGTLTQRHANWCCIRGADQLDEWAMPSAWVDNRNQRRDMSKHLTDGGLTLAEHPLKHSLYFDVKRMVKMAR